MNVKVSFHVASQQLFPTHLMQYVQFTLAVRALIVVAAGALASCPTQSVQAQQFPGVKCVVDGSRQCRVRHWADWLGGQVYFSSQKLAETFRARAIEPDQPDQVMQRNPAWTVKANHQLLLTGQFEQRRCPVTGDSISAEFGLLIAGVKLKFHDQRALDSVKKLNTTRARAEFVFSSKSFTKTFVRVVKTKTETKADPSHSSRSTIF